jgi:MFS family permease
VVSIAACVAYGFYCRRVPVRALVHLSIVLGILSTLANWAMTDERSALILTVAVAFTYMTALLIQLDLAARACPTETAGTIFALLMALSNIGTSLSSIAGGWIYEWSANAWQDERLAFNVLVGIGAAFTACCWLLVPTLGRLVDQNETVLAEPISLGEG